MKIQFKTATLSDIPQIYELASSIWESHYVPIIGKKQVDYMLHKIYSQDAQRSQMENGQEYTFIYLNEKPTGYFSLSLKSDHCFLHKLYVLTNEQTRGIGAAALSEIFKKSVGKNWIELTVNRQNYKAINFYFKHGFKIDRVEDFDIGEGFYMNDFVMKKRL